MNNSLQSLKFKIQNGNFFWPCTVFSGIILGFNPSGYGTQWIGMIALIPFLLVSEVVREQNTEKQSRKFLRLFIASWLVGAISASIGAYWITNSAHVYGHLPWILAFLITALGYGLEIGFQLFVYYQLPILLFRKSSGWELLLRFLFVLAIDPWYPRLIQWQYGGLTFSGFPLLEQNAELIGNGGLLVFSAGSTFLAIAFWRWKTESGLNKKTIQFSFGLYLLLWIAALMYGAWSLKQLEQSQFSSKLASNSATEQVRVIVIQPNFSLNTLASNPDLAHSTRINNLNTLFEDSVKALQTIPSHATEAKILVWPESVYPEAFFKDRKSQNKVFRFARKHKTFILLTTIDWKFVNRIPKFYGTSVLVSPEGTVQGRYNKKFLIPFGETIPFADWFPGIADWMRKNISNLSEFERGDEYTVFPVSDQTNISAPICFDIFSADVSREMTRNGARLIFNLSNLAWFGKTTASDNMVAVLKWRAIENRVPLVFASNNGQSVVIGADGQEISETLGLFEEGFITMLLPLHHHYSFYREHAEWVWTFWAALFLGALLLAQIKNQIFKNTIFSKQQTHD